MCRCEPSILGESKVQESKVTVEFEKYKTLMSGKGVRPWMTGKTLDDPRSSSTAMWGGDMNSTDRRVVEKPGEVNSERSAVRGQE
jgi:hypothetical protein